MSLLGGCVHLVDRRVDGGSGVGVMWEVSCCWVLTGIEAGTRRRRKRRFLTRTLPLSVLT